MAPKNGVIIAAQTFRQNECKQPNNWHLCMARGYHWLLRKAPRHSAEEHLAERYFAKSHSSEWSVMWPAL